MPSAELVHQPLFFSLPQKQLASDEKIWAGEESTAQCEYGSKQKRRWWFISLPAIYTIARVPASGEVLTLTDVISNTVPSNFALSSFLGYVYQEKCMELLLFSMEVDRYRKHHNLVSKDDPDRILDIMCMWNAILRSYVASRGHRAVGLPPDIRNQILWHHENRHNITGIPPPPETFKPAVDFAHSVIQKKLLIPYMLLHDNFDKHRSIPSGFSWLSLSSQCLVRDTVHPWQKPSDGISSTETPLPPLAPPSKSPDLPKPYKLPIATCRPRPLFKLSATVRSALYPLQFAMDFTRYCNSYGDYLCSEENDSTNLWRLWLTLLNIYIDPHGCHALELPPDVEDRIRYCSVGSIVLPPSPESLDPAIAIVFGAIQRSLLVPFLTKSRHSNAFCPGPGSWTSFDPLFVDSIDLADWLTWPTTKSYPRTQLVICALNNNLVYGSALDPYWSRYWKWMGTRGMRLDRSRVKTNTLPSTVETWNSHGGRTSIDSPQRLRSIVFVREVQMPGSQSHLARGGMGQVCQPLSESAHAEVRGYFLERWKGWRDCEACLARERV
ncbi:hypothetical protein K440DRAFT_668613 [Wilcoxina mikolae CBS 423.85]|nr:hypothetical protein K440DRAFT_668613 [Wilcoxina mikolae CBS 423.85]